MKIENYGVGGRCREVMRRLVSLAEEGEVSPRISRVILLPVPTTRDKLHLSGTDKLISDVLCGVGEGDFVVGYGIPTEDTEKIKRNGAAVYDGARDESFLLENAEITAIGALGYILTELHRIPSDLRIGVVGYGRIGRALVRKLLFLGADLTVYTSKELTRVELGESGVRTARTPDKGEELPFVDELDLLINTAPIPLGGSIPKGCLGELRIIELASGNNLEGIDGVERLPSIPDRAYPISAGRAYFHAIQKYMREV